MEPTWLSTSETERYLNISRKCLYKKKDIDRFKLGIHYRVIDPSADRLTYQWNVMAIEDLMSNAVHQLVTNHQRSSQRLALAA